MNGFFALPPLDVAALTLAYVALAAATVGLALYASWHWAVKAGATLALALLGWVTWSSWPDLLGWPTEHDVPGTFYLHAAIVDEPRFIYLWGSDLGGGLGRTVPRSFAVPYDKTLHDRVGKATRKLRKGLPVIGQVNLASVAPDPAASLERVRVASDIEFVDAPQALVPGKD